MGREARRTRHPTSSKRLFRARFGGGARFSSWVKVLPRTGLRVDALGTIVQKLNLTRWDALRVKIVAQEG